MNEISFVSLDKLIQVVDELKEKEVTEIPMEYIISAFFPDAYDNLKAIVTQSYIDGYNAGLASAEVNK